RDADFFYKSLPRDQKWRLIPDFIEDVAYVDIETTGLGHPPMAESTTITFVHRGQILQEYKHEPKRRLVRKMLKEASMFVSFFGEAFDIPFLSAEFDMDLRSKAHVDL